MRHVDLEVVEFFLVVLVLGGVGVGVGVSPRPLCEAEEVVVGGAVEAQHVLRGGGHAAEAHHLRGAGQVLWDGRRASESVLCSRHYTARM